MPERPTHSPRTRRPRRPPEAGLPSADGTPGPISAERDALVAEFQGLVRAYQREIDLVDQAMAKRLGVNRTDLRCLDILFDGPLPLGRLAARAGLTPAAATTIVDRLTAAGYVERTRDPGDRRLVRAQVTTILLARIAELMSAYIDEATGDLDNYSDQELHVVCRFLRDGRDRRVAQAQRLAETHRQPPDHPADDDPGGRS